MDTVNYHIRYGDASMTLRAYSLVESKIVSPSLVTLWDVILISRSTISTGSLMIWGRDFEEGLIDGKMSEDS